MLRSLRDALKKKMILKTNQRRDKSARVELKTGGVSLFNRVI